MDLETARARAKAKLKLRKMKEQPPEEAVSDEVDDSVGAGEAALLGAQEGVSFGLDDIIAGAAGVAGRVIGEAGSPYTAEAAQKKLQELGIQDPEGPQGLLDTYYEAKKSREALKGKAAEDQPAAYYSSLLGSSVLGGAGASKLAAKAAQSGSKAAQIASKVLPSAQGSLLKEGAKAGALTGLVEGESELLKGDITGTAADIAGGAVIGGAAPKILQGAGKSVKGIADLIPGSQTIKTAFKYGLRGKGLNIQDVDQDTIELGKKILSEIQDSKGKINIKEAKKILNSQGIKVDSTKEVNEAISDLRKIADTDLFGSSKAMQLEEGLRRLKGDNLEAEKLKQAIEKQNLLNQYKNLSKSEQAVIKGEKKVFDASLKTGDEIETIQNLDRSFDDIQDIMTDTSKGRIGGVQAKLKRTKIDPETGEEIPELYNKIVTSDTTPFQPTAPKSMVDPTTGRTVVASKDLGSGKISAKIGEILEKGKDIDKLSLEEVDDMLGMINLETSIAKNQGNISDPALQRLMQLAKELRAKSNKALTDAGVGEDLIKARSRYSDIAEAESLLGVSGRESLRSDVDKALKSKQLADTFGLKGNFKSREDKRIAEELLGDALSPTSKQESAFLQDVNELVGRTEASDNITKASLFSQVVGSVPNIAGRGVKKAQDIAKAPADQMREGFNTLINNNDKVREFAQKIQSSGKAGQEYANALLKAADLPERSRNAVMYGLYQQPAFRKLADDLNIFKDDEAEDVGETGR